MDATCIRKIRILNALDYQEDLKLKLKKEADYSKNEDLKAIRFLGIQHSLPVDDLESRIKKVIYGPDIKELTYDMRFQRISAWTNTRDFLLVKLFEDVKSMAGNKIPLNIDNIIEEIECDMAVFRMSKENILEMMQTSNSSGYSDGTDSPSPIASKYKNFFSIRTSSFLSSKTSSSTITTSDSSFSNYPECVLDPNTIEPSTPKPFFLNKLMNTEGDEVPLGPFGTTVSKEFIKNLDWQRSGKHITCKLLNEVFEPEVLATHTLNGNHWEYRSQSRPSKTKFELDEDKVDDIVYFVTGASGSTSKEVLHDIALKLLDSAKNFGRRTAKHKIARKKRGNPKKAKITSNDDHLEEKI